jgi:TM2 domain-containing membrane protein YozV
MEEALQKEDSIRARAAQLDDAKRKIYYARLNKSLKDPDTYAVLNWIFLAGLHHFYLKKYLRGFLNLGGFIIGIATLFSEYFIVGIIIISVILIFELYELFFSQAIILEYNNKVAEEIFLDLDESI